MKRDRLFIPIALVLMGIVGFVLTVRPSPPNASGIAPVAGQPLAAKPSSPVSLGLPSTGQDNAAVPANDAIQQREAWSRLAAGLVGPVPPNPPVILLSDHTIQPKPLASVRNLPYVAPSPDNKPELEIEPAVKGAGAPGRSGAPAAPAAPALVLGTMPTPTLTFDALDFNSTLSGHPPDTNGDVGTDYYMEAVNTSIGIYTKTTGSLAKSFTFNSFWSGAGTGTACDNSNRGDPIVLYDTIRQRWIFMDFAWANIQTGPYYFCFGASQTSNPLDNYNRYAIRADDDSNKYLPDYPKGGVWPDGLYFSANMFQCLNSGCSSANFEQARAYAFNIEQMEAGSALAPDDLQAQDTFAAFTLMPSNVRGALPPANTPDYFVTEDIFGAAWDVYEFHVDFTNPLSSTWTVLPTQVSQAAYTQAASTVAQPSPGNATDTLFDRMMFLNQYRNISGTESLWVQHTTGTALADTPTGIQWAQINVTGGTVITTPVQEQIFNNGGDGLNRFMGSLAVDRQGNAALGYTVVSTTVRPDIRYVGRLATDPLNQMPQGETTLLPGVTRNVTTGGCGSLVVCTRWGDYSAMTVDPVDDCTFWYANMYYPVQGANWVTRIGSFRFPTCGATTTSVTSSANPAVFGQPVALTATVAISGGGAGTPTGVVTFTIDGSAVGTVALSGGVATFTTSSLTLGSHTVTATYSGSASFVGSTAALIPDQVVEVRYYFPLLLR